MSQASFGKLPEGERLDAISQSPHYEGGAFRNTEPLPPIRGNGGIVGSLMKYVFRQRKARSRLVPCLQRKPTCGGLDRNTDTVVWLGHSSYFVQLGGRRLLIDPVFSTYASPVFFRQQGVRGDEPLHRRGHAGHRLSAHFSRPLGSSGLCHGNGASVKVGQVVCPPRRRGPILRLGATARRQFSRETGIPSLRERRLRHPHPARPPFSGRSLTRNKTLWAGFALVTPEHRIFSAETADTASISRKSAHASAGLISLCSTAGNTTRTGGTSI